MLTVETIGTNTEANSHFLSSVIREQPIGGNIRHTLQKHRESMVTTVK